MYRGSIKDDERDGSSLYPASFTMEPKMAKTAVHETHHATDKNDIRVRHSKQKLSEKQHQNAFKAGDAATINFRTPNNDFE